MTEYISAKEALAVVRKHFKGWDECYPSTSNEHRKDQVSDRRVKTFAWIPDKSAPARDYNYEYHPSVKQSHQAFHDMGKELFDAGWRLSFTLIGCYTHGFWLELVRADLCHEMSRAENEWRSLVSDVQDEAERMEHAEGPWLVSKEGQRKLKALRKALSLLQ